MKRIPIDLSLPLERVLTQALALPPGTHHARVGEAEVERAVRSLFVAAHGRSVETPIGRISIAPAIAPWLKEAPLPVRSRAELLTLAGLGPAGNGHRPL
ncbi:MAG: hypothetical protein DMF06_06140 [Verrucomicrobia bacterium]|nr:MAG: hypothetical protein DMF06_06140 [Verrucomicrobiota bacterium]